MGDKLNETATCIDGPPIHKLRRRMIQKSNHGSFPAGIAALPNAGHNDVYKTDVNVTIPALNKFIHNLN
jgi:hypothetical protein